MEHKVNRILLILLGIIGMAAIIGSIVGLWDSVDYYLKNTTKYAKPEVATITRYTTDTLIDYYDNNVTYYILHYDYVAPDGTEYTGEYERGIVNFEYVQSKLGKTCTIYVDHKHKILHGLYKRDGSTLAIGFLVPLIVMLIFYEGVLVNAFVQYYKNNKDLQVVAQVANRSKNVKLKGKSNNQTEKEDKNSKRPSRFALASLIGMYIAGIIFIASINGIAPAIERNKQLNNAHFEKVEATIVLCKVTRYSTGQSATHVSYSAHYEFKSAEGVIYKGVFDKTSTKKEEILSLLGKKVTIYIDFEQGLVYDTPTPSKSANYIGISVIASISGIIFIVALAFFVKYFVDLAKWSKYQKSLKQTENK